MRRLRLPWFAALLLAAALTPAACNNEITPLPYVVPDLSVNHFPDFALDCRSGVFPQFDRNCISTAECDVVKHQVDCCGSLAYTGIAARAVDKFNAVEAQCRTQYPACACGAKPPVDDSGNRLGVNPQVQILCKQGICTSQAI